uniref:Uncharacterized protein AlNc14C4G646 n=1 Tax=Albugo laibachii Nc14 TaxID=890382 RepID=F0W0K4_9STRA|nr:conserved hypothetical protein [Albugo laibachii Nc14]|eukprot:CCA14576.1 conserved hypothetical protein [Albugo laibachii Nc14]
MLHINVPGARGKLTDPGNGTTDFAFLVLSGCVEIVIFDRLQPRQQKSLLALLLAAGYDAEKKPMLFDFHLRAARAAGFSWSTVLVYEGEFININKGQMQFWRVVESQYATNKSRHPCVFLTWEWIYQGVSQQGILAECWFAINCSRTAHGRHYNPRRAIIEAAKQGTAIVRSCLALTADRAKDRCIPIEQWSFAPTESLVIPKVIKQRQEQMKMFLESLYPCLEAIIKEENQFCHDEIPLKAAADITEDSEDASNFTCNLCNRELVNGYQLCLGCLACSQKDNSSQIQSKLTRLCYQCHLKYPKEHQRKRLKQLRSLQLPFVSSASLLNPSIRLHSPLRCDCKTTMRCSFCTLCVLCDCQCHTRFQIRYRFATPDTLNRLMKDVKCIVEFPQFSQHIDWLQINHKLRKK